MELTVENLEAKKQEILSKIDKAEERIPNTLKCKIVLNKRQRTTAGTAHYKKNQIDINYRLFSKPENQHHLEQTLAHELAHLAAVEMFGGLGSGHGPFWKATMSMLGYPAKRCHELNTEGLGREQKAVAHGKCACRVRPIKKRRYNRMLKGVKYRCGECKTRVELVDKPEVA